MKNILSTSNSKHDIILLILIANSIGKGEELIMKSMQIREKKKHWTKWRFKLICETRKVSMKSFRFFSVKYFWLHEINLIQIIRYRPDGTPRPSDSVFCFNSGQSSSEACEHNLATWSFILFPMHVYVFIDSIGIGTSISVFNLSFHVAQFCLFCQFINRWCKLILTRHVSAFNWYFSLF